MHDALTHREDGRVSDQPLHRGRRPASVAGLVLRAVGEPLVVEGPAPVPRGLARGLDRSHLAQDRGDRVLVEDRREQHEAVLSEVALLVGGAHADERLAVQRLAHGWLVGERLGTYVRVWPAGQVRELAPLDIRAAGYRGIPRGGCVRSTRRVGTPYLHDERSPRARAGRAASRSGSFSCAADLYLVYIHIKLRSI
jgi:hypothetical protein